MSPFRGGPQHLKLKVSGNRKTPHDHLSKRCRSRSGGLEGHRGVDQRSCLLGGLCQ